ncbi:MAG: flagellin [Phycisphaerales bacterium]
MPVSSLTSLAGLRATNMIGVHQRLMEKSMERLATGKRVNHAGDDPAALPVIDKIKARRSEVEARLKHLELNERYMGARDGLASVIGDQLVELRGIVVQAANTGAMTDGEIGALQDQADGILKGIDFLANTYTFDEQQIGRAYSTRSLGLAGLASGGALNLTGGDLEAAGASVENAINILAGMRGTIGTGLKSADSERASLQEELIQLTQSQSDIEDTDYAKETGEFVRARALQQVATFVAQLARKQSTDTVLALVQGAAAGAGLHIIR